MPDSLPLVEVAATAAAAGSSSYHLKTEDEVLSDDSASPPLRPRKSSSNSSRLSVWFIALLCFVSLGCFIGTYELLVRPLLNPSSSLSPNGSSQSLGDEYLKQIREEKQRRIQEEKEKEHNRQVSEEAERAAAELRRIQHEEAENERERKRLQLEYKVPAVSGYGNKTIAQLGYDKVVVLYHPEESRFVVRARKQLQLLQINAEFMPFMDVELARKMWETAIQLSEPPAGVDAANDAGPKYIEEDNETDDNELGNATTTNTTVNKELEDDHLIWQMSHFRVYATMLKDPEVNSVLIMEADFDADFDIKYQHLTTTEKGPADWDIRWIGHCAEAEDSSPTIGSPHLHVARFPMCTTAYGISKNGMNKVLYYIGTPASHKRTGVTRGGFVGRLDTALATLNERKLINGYSIEPPLVVKRRDTPASNDWAIENWKPELLKVSKLELSTVDRLAIMGEV
ncbi:hypothetical protein GQ42DRAFT_14416 [Ramicandelaber brevisporus]|nr:hypothetical protein GQ42DRAFT_14416 [Ramicandelaber brevisporus]